MHRGHGSRPWWELALSMCQQCVKDGTLSLHAWLPGISAAQTL